MYLYFHFQNRLLTLVLRHLRGMIDSCFILNWWRTFPPVYNGIEWGLTAHELLLQSSEP